MKRLLYLYAAVGLLAAGYVLGLAAGVSQRLGVAGPLAQGTCQTFPETGQAVCGRFLQYWQANGGLAQQGFPISPEFQEVSDLNGQTYTVQYFERAVFEFHPENQPPYDVLLSQLGTFRYQQKYGGQPGQPTTPPAPGPTATPVGSDPGPPIMVDIGDPIRRNGMVFTVIRIDRLPKRVDLIYTVKNETGAPVTFVLSNADQALITDANRPLQLADPSGVTTVTLQSGEEFTGGTTWNGTIEADADHVTYTANNIIGIGNVRVNIPLQ